MARIRNISGEDKNVPLKTGGDRWVEAGTYHDVPDEDVDRYVSQETNWALAPEKKKGDS